MWRLIILLPVSLWACGCGPEGVPRYRVSGHVTYGGTPVQRGQVIFEPDASQGNSGPAGYAEIVDGNYQTQPDKGVVGGPHTVRVICLSNPEDTEHPGGKMLCPEFTAPVVLPQQTTKHDIAIPSSLHW